MGKSYIHHQFAFFPFTAQIYNLEPLGTNEKMKRIVIIIALVPRGLLWENLREEKDNKGEKKKILPSIKLCYLEPPSHDFKATFPYVGVKGLISLPVRNNS